MINIKFNNTLNRFEFENADAVLQKQDEQYFCKPNKYQCYTGKKI